MTTQPEPLTDARLAEIEALWDESTQGSVLWEINQTELWEAIPAVFAEVRRLRAIEAKLRKVCAPSNYIEGGIYAGYIEDILDGKE